MSAAPTMPEPTIAFEDDIWRILGTGASRNGQTYYHLASTTRGRLQRNGWCPMQICTWLDHAFVQSQHIQREEAARAAIAAYYRDRAQGAHAAKAAHR